MAWQQVMPVRMNPAAKVLSASTVIPAGVTQIGARLIMDEIDKQTPGTSIKVEIIDVTTADWITNMVWESGHLSKWGTYLPPTMIFSLQDSNGMPVDLGGLVLQVGITPTVSVRFGAEVELT